MSYGRVLVIVFLPRVPIIFFSNDLFKVLPSILLIAFMYYKRKKPLNI